jgi:hypothetical protein
MKPSPRTYAPRKRPTTRDLYSDYSEQARRGLEKLRPEEYPERSEIVPVPNAMGCGAERKAGFVR